MPPLHAKTWSILHRLGIIGEVVGNHYSVNFRVAHGGGAYRSGASPMAPGIDHLDAAALEIGHIAGRHGDAVGASRRRNLAVGKADRPTRIPAVDEYGGERDGSSAVEGQHPAREIAGKDRLDRARQCIAPPSGRKQANNPAEARPY